MDPNCEVTKGWPCLTAFSSHTFFVVYCGRLTGVFTDWQVVSLLSQSYNLADAAHSNYANTLMSCFSGNRHVRFNTFDEAFDSRRNMCLDELVEGSLLLISILPRIISDAQAQQHLDNWRARRRPQTGPAYAPIQPSTSQPVIGSAVVSISRCVDGSADAKAPSGSGTTSAPVQTPQPMAGPSSRLMRNNLPAWVVIRGVHPGVFYWQ